ncbi:hypothetical protein [Micromonospora sp. NPDC049891]|uniref:hypothetical protein n=1 Tax=Micromonospora sp. NPDC049891 TaxID=3155655 RepID=UPI00340C4287
MWISREASPQFYRPIKFRVIKKLDWTTYDGWVWIEGYQLNDKGDAVARRALFVLIEGLRKL